MKAMILKKLGPMDGEGEPLELVDWPRPQIDSDEVLIRVKTCGVCHTELDEIEGRTPPENLPIVLGHQVVGIIDEVGQNVSQHQIGNRVGVGWIFKSDGTENENVSQSFQATGRDADGGYAEFMKVHQDYAFPMPETFSDLQAAPLLCAGSIGYRALKLTNLNNGQRLGLTGFGGSAHLVIQLAQFQFPDSPVYVFARDEKSRLFATEMGAVWAGDTTEPAPEKLHAIIDTTPAWTPVVEALENLCPGGRLVINAIRKEGFDQDRLLQLKYEDHLWLEKEIKTVANITGRDIAEFLEIAAKIPIEPQVETYPLEDANRALRELKQGSIQGAKVLVIE